MKRWFEQRKALMIVLGIVYIILALFVVSAYVTNTVNYVLERQMSTFWRVLPRAQKAGSLIGELYNLWWPFQRLAIILTVSVIQATPRGGLPVYVALQALRLPANQTSIFHTYSIQSTITTCALPVELPIRLLNGVGLEPTTSSSKIVIK